MKILIYDIETSPSLGYVWGAYDQNVIAFKEDWQLLSFAFKWLGEGEPVCYSQRTEGDERQLVIKLHQLLSEADVVVAHNGDAFDNKKVSAKFIEFGLKPPAPYESIDTLKVARRYFKFTSNKLDSVGQLLKCGRKLETGGFGLWLKVMSGDKKAWRQFEEYNRQDVRLLEKVYLKLRPWIRNHPNVNREGVRANGCPNCGSSSLEGRGIVHTKTAARQRFYCRSCGSWSRSTISVRNQLKVVGL